MKFPRTFNTFAPLPRRGGEFTQADRRFGRALLLGLGLLALISGAGPLISYRNDVRINRYQLQRRVEREASIAAESLTLHLELLEGELERVAQRPEVDLRDNTTAPEQTLLMLAHHDSVLFSGVALLGAEGRALWTEPRGLFAPDSNVRARRWFQAVLKGDPHAEDVLAPGQPSFVVAVPVLRKGTLTGVIAGIINASDRLLPVGLLPGLEVAVVAPGGEILYPETPPLWARRPGFLSGLSGARASAELTEWPESNRLVSARPVGRTGLTLVLVADMAPALVAMRARILWQLVFTGTLQLVALALVTLYLRGNYRRFLQVDLAASEQQKMAALGTAAALIAHEVKNSLNGLHAATSTLQSGADPSLGVSAIRGQVDRLAHLASSLLYFGKPATPRILELQVDETVRQAVEGLRAHPEWTEVDVQLALGPPVRAEADPFFLITAIDNLLRNAIEATVAAKDLGQLTAPRVQVRVFQEQDRVVVTVEDNAGGPPQGFEERLFAPFVTSKPRGIGLGLAMARRAMEQQGGTLSFERTAEGSRFLLRLRPRVLEDRFG